MVNSNKFLILEPVEKNIKLSLDNKYEDKQSCQDIVLNCPELIKIIFEHLTIPTDKLNFKLTCGRFYESVRYKIWYKQESALTDKFHTTFTMFSQGIGFRFIRDSLKIFSLHPPNWNDLNIYLLSHKIKNNLGNTNKLVIEFDPNIQIEIFDKLNCFKTIKTLEFCGDIRQQHFFLFTFSKSLEPQAITFNNFVNFSNSNQISTNEKWLFPKSMKNLTFKCDNENCLKLLQDGLVNFAPNEIDTLDLVISPLFPSNLALLNDFYNVTKYFKKVNIIYSGKFENSDFVIFSKSVILNDGSSKITFFLKFSLYTDIWYHELLYVCSRLKFFIIDSLPYTSSSKRILEEYEINYIYHSLYMMKYLDTLIIDFWIMNSGISFETFVSVINKNLKNLQLVNCQGLKLIDLKNIANNLKKIEVLSIHEIESEEITMEEIFELFPTVSCLEIFFSKSFNSSKILNVLKGENNNENNCKLKWPRTKILNIFTLFCSDNELDELRNIVSNTPLKSGQANLAIQSYRKFYENRLLRLIRMTFQKCSGCSDYFKVFKIKHFPHRYRIFMYEET